MYVLVFIVPHVDIELEDNKQFISNIPRINAHIKFCENLLRFTQVIVLKVNTDVLRVNNSKMDEMLQLAIPKQMSTVSMYILSLVKIH